VTWGAKKMVLWLCPRDLLDGLVTLGVKKMVLWLCPGDLLDGLMRDW
jgi:hypothetical protein